MGSQESHHEHIEEFSSEERAKLDDFLQSKFDEFIELFCEKGPQMFSQVCVIEGALKEYLIINGFSREWDIWLKNNKQRTWMVIQYGKTFCSISGLKCSPVLVGLQLVKYPIKSYINQ